MVRTAAPEATNTRGFRASSSFARPGRRSKLPSAKRAVKTKCVPSTSPASLIPARSASTRRRANSAPPGTSIAISGRSAPFWANADSGDAIVAPPASCKKSRRLIASAPVSASVIAQRSGTVRRASKSPRIGPFHDIFRQVWVAATPPLPYLLPMKFLDEAKVYVRSGDGGNGAVAFRREKFIEFGGPSGGNGGRGGDIIVEAVDGLNTLIDYRYQQHFKAQKGTHGMGKDRHGAGGKDLTLKVPVGTQIFDEDRETLLADLTKVGEHVVLAHGGNGGFGNAHFKSSTNRAPRNANPGQPGEERWIWLRLKLIADAGLVGLPNAGKSTFLSKVSAARPKIADYPFTTLHPQLGVVDADGREFVLADIPGLIEGAHEGVGLGDRFLGHVERCRVLLHLIDGTGADAGVAYKTVRAELSAYGHDLTDKPEIVALNKADSLSPDEIKQQIARLKRAAKKTPLVVSAVSGEGVPAVLRALWDIIEEARRSGAQSREPHAAWHP